MYEQLYIAKTEVMIDYAQGTEAICAELREAIKEGFNVIDHEIKTLELTLKKCSLKNQQVLIIRFDNRFKIDNHKPPAKQVVLCLRR
ncbi:hypothetical protein [Proteus terrae]|uniref:hypothetical protein n=1 Tax=Proteus terrae TaxID=1574161 RepID=UPI0018C4F244|nr:hypothetical protein [Proteus terrae]MBG2839157.1 hypothetical protein [Proteus terrae subsp. cibarius]MBG2869193.1 hypothetical protein [Proteus terrae subsp. cibarius]MBJ2108353.1 hypothetical protein [Proteus terrae]MBJ2132225.1 hypothetical protein [Proteus terrae]MCO7051674.1 hypothetical protein [Proteus terrae]